MDNKKIVIYGGGTVNYIRPHLALCAPAYGATARKLAELAKEIIPNMDVDLRLTKMAGGAKLETNDDLERDFVELTKDDTTKIVIVTAAICDYEPELEGGCSKNGFRLRTSDGPRELTIHPAAKLIKLIRERRKDIFLVGCKTTTQFGCTESEHEVENNFDSEIDEQYVQALNLCKQASCNLVLANDLSSRMNMIVTPEESFYCKTTDRDKVLRELLVMAKHRTHLTFTRSQVIDGKPIPWSSELVPESLRTVVNFCIKSNAYKPFNGVTAGHFAFKLNDNTFLTSIRKTNFNNLPETGLVKIVTDGPDTVLAFGARPSVGGQSQRIVFRDHPGMDCIVHFHCPLKPGSQIPTVSQKEFECGSHECGENTSRGLRQFGSISAVYLDNHGPNIVFNHKIDPQEVINFITDNCDLSQKTGGFVSVQSRLNTSSTLETAQSIL